MVSWIYPEVHGSPFLAEKTRKEGPPKSPHSKFPVLEHKVLVTRKAGLR